MLLLHIKLVESLVILLVEKKLITIQSLFGFRLDVNIENFDPKNPAFNPVGKDKTRRS